MFYPKIGAASTRIPATVVTTVDCQKQVRSWRLLRAVVELLIPTCNCTFVQEHEQENPNFSHKHNTSSINSHSNRYNPKPRFVSSASSTSSTVTGTIFGYRRGKISFCIQSNSKSTNPILLLEFSLPTTVLAREMQGGILRIALECKEGERNDHQDDDRSLLSMPLWSMHCNGRKVGYAKKRRPSKEDFEALNTLKSVVVGAGVVNGKEICGDDELMYLRANFKRVSGSRNSESFHLIDPAGKIGQELSIFFCRSSA